MNKRGQIAIWIIFAIAIVAIIVIIFTVQRGLPEFITGVEFSPITFLTSCIEDDLSETISLLSSQGGYLEPEGFILYGDEKVKYLCYTPEYYKTCVVQQPLIKENFESELGSFIGPRANACAGSLVQEYERRGFDVSAGEIDTNVSIDPGVINIEVTAPMTVSRGDSVQTFTEFDVDRGSGIYDLLLIATSIVDFESTSGDSETNSYIQYYPDLKIEKNKLSDGTTIYRLGNTVTGESFTFASRSLVFPPGFGVE